MKPRYLLLQKRIKEHPYATVTIVSLQVILFFFLAYRLSWDWTGFSGTPKTYKTFYDWLQLLFVPVALAFLGFYLNYREKSKEDQRSDKEQQEEARRLAHEKEAAEKRAKEEQILEQQRTQTRRELAEDNQRESALQTYIKDMSELLLHENLRNSKKGDEVRSIARVLTLTTLRRLDPARKSSVVLFLKESDLIEKDNLIVDLSGADLSGVILNMTNLNNIDLYETDMSGAQLSHSSLEENLTKAN